MILIPVDSYETFRDLLKKYATSVDVVFGHYSEAQRTFYLVAVGKAFESYEVAISLALIEQNAPETFKKDFKKTVDPMGQLWIDGQLLMMR